MFSFLVIANLLIGLVTFLPILRYSHWLVRDLDFPRLQIAVVAALVLTLDLIFLDFSRWSSWLLLLICLISLIWQLWWVLPYSPLWPKEVQTALKDNLDGQLTILTSNVLTPNRNSQALIDLVEQHQPDILLTLETDSWWQEQLSLLETSMPHCIKYPLDNLYGMHFYSRLPIEDPQVKLLIQKDVPSFHLRLILPSGEKVKLHLLHPAPPSPTENTESTERDKELLMVAKNIDPDAEPVIVTGDLNDVAWSRTTRLFRKLSGLLDPRVGRGMFNTFHVDYPFLRWPLDHLFHSDHFSLREIKTLPSIDSDHFPLLTRLSFEPKRKDKQSGLTSKKADLDKAETLVE